MSNKINKQDYPLINENLTKLLDRIVYLLEVWLITDFVERGLPQQNIRKILGIDMRRITHLSKFIKKKGAKND